MRDKQPQPEWLSQPLSSLCDLTNGYAFKPLDWDVDGIPIIRIQNLNGGQDFNFYKGTVPDKFHVNTGDLLFSWSGNRGTSFGPYVWNGPNGLLNQHIFKVHEKKGTNPRWLFFALDKVRQKAEQDAHGGSGLVHIKRGDLLRYLVECPPPVQQGYIANVLGTIDDAITKTDTLIEKILAVRIGLIEDLLTFGISERGRPRCPDDVVQTELGSIPANWSRASLDSLATAITSGSRGWAKYYSETGAKFLRIGNLTRQHINLRLDDLVHVTPPRGQEGSRTAVQDNDLLISITADIGIIGSIPPDFGEAYVNQHIALVRLKGAEVNPRWPAHFLSSRRSQILFQKLNDQGAKAGINLPAVGRIEVPLPSRDEQDAIVERLDAADETVARYRVERRKLAALRLGLRDDLLSGHVCVHEFREAAE